MTLLAPPLVLLALIASASAGLAHALWGRRWVQLPIFWLAAFAGCLLVYALQVRLPLELPRPAGVPVLEAVLAAWLLLIVASRLRI
jgi:hypothetical protein